MFTTIASAMPIKARADGGTYNVSNATDNILIVVDAGGNQTIDIGNGALPDANPVITGNNRFHRILVSVADGQEANLTLRNVNIDLSGQASEEHALMIDGSGSVNIELDGTNSLRGANNRAGLIVRTNNSLTIKDDSGSAGSLTATGGSNGPGIGGSHITITGGTIIANGGSYAAGIGGGQCSHAEYDVSYITITGGNVTATGGRNAAGIGGSGNDGDASHITISGGTVTATGGQNGAGIGGGDGGNGSNITISGGNVTATGGSCGAGIGSGRTNNASYSITISGSAQVSVAGGSANGTYGAGAAIGGGGQVGSIDGTAVQPNGSLNGNGYIHTYDPGTSVDDIRNDINNQGGGGNGGNNNNAGNHHSGGGSSGGSSHSETHIHSYSWVVTEKPTAYENGKMVYQCSCGHVLDRADIEASAELITEGITSFSTAAQGATVKMDFGYYFSINKAFATAHDARADVTTIITYYYKGEHFELTIPAGFRLLDTIDEKGWAGFEFIKSFPGAIWRTLP